MLSCCPHHLHLPCAAAASSANTLPTQPTYARLGTVPPSDRNPRSASAMSQVTSPSSSSSHPSPELWLIRHGQTEWSMTGQHTGRTDIPLTPHGEALAVRVQHHLNHRPFALVLTSPLLRARETARLAGYGDAAQDEADLQEWDYGQLEGRTSSDIQREYPGWSIWQGPWPGGETLEEVAARARRVVQRCVEVEGDVAVFAHGHILRVLAACWLRLPPDHGRLLLLDVASVCRLGWDKQAPVVRTWNRSFDSDEDAQPRKPPAAAP